MNIKLIIEIKLDDEISLLTEGDKINFENNVLVSSGDLFLCNNRNREIGVIRKINVVEYLIK